MQGGEHYAEDGQHEGQFNDHFADLRPAEPFEHGRSELNEENCQVEHNTQTNFEEQGCSTLRNEDGVRESPRTAEVVLQCEYNKGVAEECGQDCRTYSGVKALESEDIAGCGSCVSAGCESNTAEQVESDPDTPWVVVIKVGHGTDTLSESEHGKDQTHNKDGTCHQIECIEGRFRAVIRGSGH